MAGGSVAFAGIVIEHLLVSGPQLKAAIKDTTFLAGARHGHVGVAGGPQKNAIALG